MRELVAGTTRFNGLRRGMPKMSPTLLSERLKELEQAGVFERKPLKTENSVFEYYLTGAEKDLRPIVEANWNLGQIWIFSSLSLKRLDALLLMWEVRRNLDPLPLPLTRTVVQFLYSGLPATKSY